MNIRQRGSVIHQFYTDGRIQSSIHDTKHPQQTPARLPANEGEKRERTSIPTFMSSPNQHQPDSISDFRQSQSFA
jgi:hypothetical protein